MSAHWYWDWDWSGGGSGNNGRGGTSPTTGAPQTRPDDKTPKPAHYNGDPAPFPHPGVKPCQKIQVYYGTSQPAFGDKPPHYPHLPDAQWHTFAQQEMYQVIASTDPPNPPNPPSPVTYMPIRDSNNNPSPTWWYWIACEKASDCCPGGCIPYFFMTKLQKQVVVPGVNNGNPVDVYIQDFKCQCPPNPNPHP